jgi:hypothetical protein
VDSDSADGGVNAEFKLLSASERLSAKCRRFCGCACAVYLDDDCACAVYLDDDLQPPECLNGFDLSFLFSLPLDFA